MNRMSSACSCFENRHEGQQPPISATRLCHSALGCVFGRCLALPPGTALRCAFLAWSGSATRLCPVVCLFDVVWLCHPARKALYPRSTCVFERHRTREALLRSKGTVHEMHLCSATRFEMHCTREALMCSKGTILEMHFCVRKALYLRGTCALPPGSAPSYSFGNSEVYRSVTKLA